MSGVEVDDDEMKSLENQAETIISADRRCEFASFLNIHQNKIHSSASGLILAKLLKLICLHRAIGCATELLSRKSGLLLDLNVQWEHRFSPLYFAAQSLSYHLTEMLLQHGAEADFHCDDGSHDPVFLPLSAALKALCDVHCVKDWTTKKSIFKLFYIFCLQELKESLDTVKLLASSTSTTNVQSICFSLVEQGEVVQLAALFITAWDKLLAPCVGGDIESSPAGSFICQELKGVAEAEIGLMKTQNSHGKKLFKPLKDKKTNLATALELAKISLRGSPIIEEYRQSLDAKLARRCDVPFNVAYKLFIEGGLTLKPRDVYSDDVNCLRPILKPEEIAQLKEDLKKEIRPGSSLYFAKKCKGVAAVALSPCRQYHTCGDVGLKLYKPVGNQLSKTMQQKPLSPNVLAAARIGARLLFAAKRCIK